MYLFSKNEWCVYDSAANYKDLPSDVIEITYKEFISFLSYRDGSKGKILVSGVYPFELQYIPQPTSEEIATQNQRAAKQTRDKAVSANITVHGVDWQVANDAEDIRKVIGDAETISASEDDTTMFRLADNSWRETTLSELRDVLKAHIARKQDVWNQMAVWDSGDKQSEFEVK